VDQDMFIGERKADINVSVSEIPRLLDQKTKVWLDVRDGVIGLSIPESRMLRHALEYAEVDAAAMDGAA